MERVGVGENASTLLASWKCLDGGIIPQPSTDEQDLRVHVSTSNRTSDRKANRRLVNTAERPGVKNLNFLVGEGLRFILDLTT